MRWRLTIEGCGSDIEHIPGPEKIVTDRISRLYIVGVESNVDKLYDKCMEINVHTCTISV